MRLIGFSTLALIAFSSCATANKITPGVRIHVTPPKEPQRSKTTERWTDEVRAVAQSGDWFAVRAYTPADDAVAVATNIPISHAGIYDGTKDQSIEAHWNGVSARPLRDLVHASHRILVIRPKWWTPENGKKAVSKAVGWIGSGYDFSGLVGVPDKDRFYCSELAMKAYEESRNEDEHVPRIIEPGQMYLWGKVIYDSGWRD